jgi:hypothetical protein
MHPVITEEAAKAKAKALRKALAEKGVELNHQACIDVISRIEGEKGWSALNAKQNRSVKQKPRQKEKEPNFNNAPQGADYLEYTHEVVFRNPEGNRIHQELYKTADQAREAQAKWLRQGHDWGADYMEFRYENGIPVYPGETSEFDFEHQVRFTRPDGSGFIDRFETELEARNEARRWANFRDPVVNGEYLGVGK